MKHARKLQRLNHILSAYGTCLIAYSGGVDSALLVFLAYRCLGPENVLAVTARSASLPREELQCAQKFARRHGIPHVVITTDEFGDKRFVANTRDRCFYCKSELFLRLKRLAVRRRFAVVAEASTLSDAGDYRPGSRAKERHGVRSPFIEAGFSKETVREVSRQLRLPTWDKPSAACLASRIPYGTPVSDENVGKVYRAEKFLHTLGFREVRVRHYGALCRIEVPVADFGRLIKGRTRLIARLKKIGYTYVTFDLEGLRSGSMNELLRKPRP